MSKCHFYLVDLQHFTLLTDHLPLVSIINHYSLDVVENPRLQRLKEKILTYIFTAVWRAEKQLCIPDALSCTPVSQPTPENEMLCTDAAASLRSDVLMKVIVLTEELPVMDPTRTFRILFPT